MTTAMGSVSLTGLLGGTAGKIDTDALVESLMKVKARPQSLLMDKLEHQQDLNSNLQELNSRLRTITNAAMSITDLAFDGVPTQATSSNSGVVASSSGGALAGSSTFHVDHIATAQVSTIKADPNGDLVADHTAGLDFVINPDGDDPIAHHISLQSGSAADVAAAVNKANIGIRAAVVNTSDGEIVQFSAAATGAENKFTVTGFTETAHEIVQAADAKISVGDGSAGSYSISSSNNTFTNAMPGVTFSISAAAVGTDVTISVSDDVDSLGKQISGLVDALNSAKGGISLVTGEKGLLQGHTDITSIGRDLADVISMGYYEGVSLTAVGIDMDKDGVVTFDAAAFRAAYQADDKGTLDVISHALAAPLRQVSEAASAPVVGTLSQTITADQGKVEDLRSQIAKWDERLDKMQAQLVIKYTAMQSALATLQSQSDWLTSMFDSINGKKD